MKRRAFIITSLVVVLVAGGAAAALMYGPKTVKVPELGVKLSVSHDLGDLQFVQDVGDEGKAGVDFSSKALVAIGGDACKAKAERSISPFPLGQVVRSDETPDKVAGEIKNNPDEGIGEYIAKVGDEYLYYKAPPAEACSGAPGVTQLQKKQAAQLKEALKNAKAL